MKNFVICFGLILLLAGLIQGQEEEAWLDYGTIITSDFGDLRETDHWKFENYFPTDVEIRLEICRDPYLELFSASPDLPWPWDTHLIASGDKEICIDLLPKGTYCIAASGLGDFTLHLWCGEHPPSVKLIAEPTVTVSDQRLTLNFTVADEFRQAPLYMIMKDGNKVGKIWASPCDSGSYSYVDPDLENNQLANYSIVAVQMDQCVELSYDGKTVWSGVVGVPQERYGVVTNDALDQCYPNPFNPKTQISYDLKEAGLVTLKVYNVLGGEMVTLVHEQKEAGHHQVIFDGSSLPGGLYFYRLEFQKPGGNYFVTTKKMVLMK